MKTVLTIITTAVLSMRVIAAADPVRKADAIQWQAEMRWGGEFGRSPIKAFTRIPASLRTVPWHPDDDYGTGHSTTILDASLNPPGFAMMNWTFTSGVTIKERVTFRTGISLQGFGRSDLAPGNSGAIRSVNIYSGKFERGYGTSLVYDAIKQARWSPITGPLVEIEVSVRRGYGLIIGGWRKRFDYDIEHGYDRYNSLQVRDQVTIANATAYHPYVGIRFNLSATDGDPSNDSPEPMAGLYITVGPLLLRPRFSPAGQGTAIEGSTHGLLFGAGVHFGGPLLRFGRKSAFSKK
jgi:hypothetical protein